MTSSSTSKQLWRTTTTTCLPTLTPCWLDSTACTRSSSLEQQGSSEFTSSSWPMSLTQSKALTFGMIWKGLYTGETVAKRPTRCSLQRLPWKTWTGSKTKDWWTCETSSETWSISSWRPTHSSSNKTTSTTTVYFWESANWEEVRPRLRKSIEPVLSMTCFISRASRARSIKIRNVKPPKGLKAHWFRVEDLMELIWICLAKKCCSPCACKVWLNTV